MDETSVKRIEKLPKWAQNRIRSLVSENDSLKRHLETAKGKKTKTYWYTPSSLGTFSFIPDEWTYVVFRFEEGKGELVITRTENGINVSSSRSRLGILPDAANRVDVVVDKE